MNENSVKQKICPSCNQPNIVTSMYCRYCGMSLEEIQPVNIEAAQVPVTSETNKVEFNASYKGKKYGLNFCVLIFFIFMLGLMILPTILFPLGIFGTLIMFIIVFPMLLCLLIYTLRYTRGMEKIRTFSISDQAIKIIFPNKPPFQINWSDFDTIHIYKYYIFIPALWDLLSSRRKAYKINFLSKDVLKNETSIELEKDFNRSGFKKIKSLIEQYAHRLNKEYIWGKNIQKVRRKREKKQK
ncbi:MAG: zinc ribbon domain-containing protein [Promethearchaeota archaeon]|nr:MAG: zinc ribbon domain-containing protein [Candidatus Lokiarchaeota archaeon]